LKLSVLFAKYLYQHKQLSLPGIGVFQVDKSVSIPDTSDKSSTELLPNIKFTHQPVSKPDDGFIEFIRTHTGKIKPLAESDLESYLEEGKNMLNTGKPFHLEGIGSLHKTRSGVYEFKPGEPLLERFEHSAEKDNDQFRRNKTAYENRYNTSSNNTLRKLLIAAGVLIGVAAVVWGGYSLYTKKASDKNVIESEAVGMPNDTVNSDSLSNKITDPTNLQPLVNAREGKYYFVIETTDNKGRAMKRFNQLKSLGTNIQIKTSDSILFKLFFDIPAQTKDTIRIKDSLRLRYGSKRIIVE